jgi:hypothetical protein
MRHEVPIAIPDPFLYAEGGGERRVVASSFELDRIAQVAPELQVTPLEEFGIDELYAQGLTRDEIELEVVLRAARRFGIEQAAVPDVPASSPTTCAPTGSSSPRTATSSWGDAGSRPTPSSPGSAAPNALPRPR